MAEKKAASDAGQAEAQKNVDEAKEKGFIGREVDETPNEEYSLEKPDSWAVPEADPKAAAKAGSRKFARREAE